MNCARRVVLAAGVALVAPAQAGHEFPFYPSFYPQEISVEALDARTAAERLAKGTLHAYAGAASAPSPAGAKLASVASLGAYVVASFDRRAPPFGDAAARCAAARSLKDELGPDAVWHPYPVTPFHADYLYHADRAEAARASGAKAQKRQAGVQIERVEPSALMAKARARYNGWSGPPWLRQGWFHAYLLLAPPGGDAQIEEPLRRLTHGEHGTIEERLALERGLVERLQAGCERVVLGYTVRRESYSVEYSAGVENVGYDALGGMASAIFPRTVKLRDFPWNGWLNVAVPAAPSSAWNPVAGGFEDPFGRLVWSAVADEAFLPSPHGGGWIENRVNAVVEKGTKPFDVPGDALFSAGKTATSRVVYRVRNSAFHDGTRMSAADFIYAYALAAHPALARATAPARERLRGVRLLRVDTETLAVGEEKLTYEVPVVEVYLDGAPDATVAPPWSTLPWHALALFEEGARRGYLDLSMFDPVRDAALVERLSELARELESRAHVPRALAPYMRAEEARERYRRLREFHAAHGHWLVTNGPYLLDRWDGRKAVLTVFRHPTYPKGVGSFNHYAVALKSHVTRIERDARGAKIQTESEWLERLGRDVRVVRGSFAQRLAERLTSPGATAVPVCHYLLVGRQGDVAAAGTVRAADAGSCRLEFATPAGTRGYRLVVSAVLENNMANAPIKIVPWDD